GLPGETIRIAHGDIFVKSPGRSDFLLARKPLRHQSAMQINVYDDRYRPRGLAGLSEWSRWRPGPAWNSSSETESRYRAGAAGAPCAKRPSPHLLPDPDQGDPAPTARERPRPPRSTLITDFYSYNTNLEARLSDLVGESHYDQEQAWMQPHWVGDLTLES